MLAIQPDPGGGGDKTPWFSASTISRFVSSLTVVTDGAVDDASAASSGEGLLELDVALAIAEGED